MINKCAWYLRPLCYLNKFLWVYPSISISITVIAPTPMKHLQYMILASNRSRTIIDYNYTD